MAKTEPLTRHENSGIVTIEKGGIYLAIHHQKFADATHNFRCVFCHIKLLKYIDKRLFVIRTRITCVTSAKIKHLAVIQLHVQRYIDLIWDQYEET